MSLLPDKFDEFVALLRRRHATVMAGRPATNPGAFKTKVNRAGQTIFVAPELVAGTLEKGFEFLQALGEPFHRAVFIMFIVSEVTSLCRR